MTKSNVILFRRIGNDEEEISIAKKYFDVVEQRSHVDNVDLVIGRYSVLPYYKELEGDLPLGALINSYEQHRYVADLSNWYQDLHDITPYTWFSLEEFKRDNSEGQFVLKGLTNSRKFLWSSHMFAKDKKAVDDVYCRLMDDSMISDQGICIRKFINFKNYGVDIHGMPITKEFRVFVYNGQIVAKGFYWSNHMYDIQVPDVDDISLHFLHYVIKIIGNKANFYTLDVAQDVDDKWWVVELNDGQMAGLSGINADEFYSNLKKAVD